MILLFGKETKPTPISDGIIIFFGLFCFICFKAELLASNCSLGVSWAVLAFGGDTFPDLINLLWLGNVQTSSFIPVWGLLLTAEMRWIFPRPLRESCWRLASGHYTISLGSTRKHRLLQKSLWYSSLSREDTSNTQDLALLTFFPPPLQTERKAALIIIFKW